MCIRDSSGRSISGINIYDEMKKVSDLLISFGGHEMACGFSIDEDRVKELRERLNNQAKAVSYTHLFSNKSKFIFLQK